VLTGPVTAHQAAIAAALPVIGLAAGLVCTRLALKRSRQVEHKHAWVIVAAVREVLLVWLVIAGAYGSIAILPLSRNANAFAHQALLVMLIGSATVVAARLAAGGVRRFALRTEGGMMYGSIFLNITRLVVVCIGLLIILQSLGVSITPILTALGVGGLAVALALQDTLANLFAGIHVIASKYVKGGDYIRLDSGEEGYVVDINWRHTSLRQIPDNLILVPNAKLASTIVTNFHRPEQPMGVPVKLGVSYDSDLELVERVTLEVAREVLQEVEGGIHAFEPWIWYDEFSVYSINLIVYLRVREFYQQYPLRHEFIKRLHKRYAAEGIEIPFPVQTVFWKEAPGSNRPNEHPNSRTAHQEIEADAAGKPPVWRNLMRRPGP
jgi:small-conductance mechanosensitive channel